MTARSHTRLRKREAIAARERRYAAEAKRWRVRKRRAKTTIEAEPRAMPRLPPAEGNTGNREGRTWDG